MNQKVWRLIKSNMNKMYQTEWFGIRFSSFKKVEYGQLENGTYWIQVNND